MRTLAIGLIELFGPQYNGKVNAFLSEQWIRHSNYKNFEFALSDIEENHLVNTTLKVVKQLGLTANELLSHTMMRAYVDVNGNISPVIAFKGSFYKQLLSNVAQSEVTLFNAADNVVFKGKDKPLLLEKSKKLHEGAIVGGFINGKCLDGETFSLLVNKEQWQENVRSYYDVKLNGTEFVDQYWEEVVGQGFIYHRLIDEFMGTLLSEHSPDNYEKYRAVVDYENSFYDSKVSQSELVISNRGYRLGRTVKLFDSIDVLAAKKSSIEEKKQINKRVNAGKGIKVVVDNSSVKPLNPANINDAESYDEWGGF